MRSLRLALIAFILVTVARAEDFASRADAYISALVAQNKFRGTGFAGKGAKPLFRKGYPAGQPRVEHSQRADTKFRLGSITKQFTATAILGWLSKAS
jgi:CubicO group peptidase (beta-lactamase class C family)